MRGGCITAERMFDTVILLTGAAERAVLPSVLRGHNPHLAIVPVETGAELDALGPDLLRRARLVAFVTPVIVPQAILAQLGFGAFNFHPGPPSYPGWAPAHFALYDQATEFGATAHIMVEQVDAGPIVEVEMFAIPSGIPVLGLEGLAYAHLAFLFWRMAKWLASDPEPLPARPIKWGARKYTRRAYRAMCEIPLDIPKDELDRRIRVFGGHHFGISPTINLHGVEFRAVTAPPVQPADSPHGCQSGPAMMAAMEPDLT
jgi:methionyl-tRNA formyltransferase